MPNKQLLERPTTIPDTHVAHSTVDSPDSPTQTGHIDPDCTYLGRIENPTLTRRDTFKGKICLHCSGRALYYTEHNSRADNGYCRDCGGEKTNGVCGWCESFDAVHNHPKSEPV